MKKLAIFIILLPIISCTDSISLESNMNNDIESDEYNKVTMVIPPLEVYDELPETKINIGTSDGKYLWVKDDIIGVYPEIGSPIYFTMPEDAVGKNEVTFNGGGWFLLKGTKYYSYFPFVPDYYINKNAIPISYVGQIQEGNGNSNMGVLGNYCFMKAIGHSNSNNNSIQFVYKRVQMPFVFMIPVESGEYTSIDIVTGENNIIISGTMDPTNDSDRSINNPVMADHISIDLKNIRFLSSNELVVYAMIPPFDMQGKQLNINIKKSDGSIITSSTPGKNYVLDKFYGHKMNLSVPLEINIPGEETEFEINITTRDEDIQYSYSSNDSWLTFPGNGKSGNGTSKLKVKASKCTSQKRTGKVIISESVTKNGITTVLENIITINQDYIGMGVGVDKWGNGNVYNGETD